MSTDYRSELQRLVEAYEEHGGKWPDHHEQALFQAVEDARAALAQPEPVAPTDEELGRRFRVWWHNEGSGLPPLPGMDHEEHVRRISEIAWANGAYVARFGTPANTINQED